VKQGDNMISAYILIDMKPGNFDKAIDSMRKIENIAKISVVAGEYDIVIRVQVSSLDRLLKVTNKLQMIDGVKNTTTQIIEKELAL
jgi:DNA-binding Lrp family transcriptional regulator